MARVALSRELYLHMGCMCGDLSASTGGYCVLGMSLWCHWLDCIRCCRPISCLNLNTLCKLQLSS